MQNEYYTPITELDSDSTCEEIVEGYKEIIRQIDEYKQELKQKRTGIDEEDYYQGELIEIGVTLKELEEELFNIAQLIIQKDCEDMLPHEYAGYVELMFDED